MVAVVAAVAVDELVVVVAELQGRVHLLVAERPVAVLVVEVVAAVLQEDADRLLVAAFADHAGIDVAAADVREAADVAEHLAEQVGPLPGDGERADAAAGDAADRVAVGIVGERGTPCDTSGRISLSRNSA